MNSSNSIIYTQKKKRIQISLKYLNFSEEWTQFQDKESNNVTNLADQKKKGRNFKISKSVQIKDGVENNTQREREREKSEKRVK